MGIVDGQVHEDHAEIRGVRLAYSDQGAGPLVITAHGLTSSRENNRRMGLSDFGGTVGRSHRVISYDARGHGRSTGTDDPSDYTWAALANDLLALADAFSSGEPVSVIGSSMGTGTTLHAVTIRPDRIARLVLTAPPTAWQTRAAQADVYRSMASMVEASTPDAIAELFGASGAPVPPVFADVPGWPAAPDIPFALLPIVFRGAGLSDLPPLEDLARIDQPTLILAWDGDPGHPVTTAEALVEAIPHAELHVTTTHADLMTWAERAAEFLER